jgi:transcriptional regulator with XRE-family HTH domain
MNIIKHIRTQLFQIATQGEFATAIGTTQATVSRLESGSEITLTVQKAIRAAAKARGIDWDDSLFYDFSNTGEQEQVSEEMPA